MIAAWSTRVELAKKSSRAMMRASSFLPTPSRTKYGKTQLRDDDVMRAERVPGTAQLSVLGV